MARVETAGTDARKDFSSALASRIKKHGFLVEVNEGQVLLRQGELVPGLYLVSRGIVAAMSSAGDGRRRFLYPLMPGMYFSPFPTGKNRSDATLQALSEAYVYILQHDAFQKLLKTDKAFLPLVGELVNHTLAANAMLLAACRIPSAKERLRAYMRAHLMLQPVIGTEAVQLLDSRISQNLLAEMLGVTRPYMNQLLKAMRSELEL